MFSANDAEFVDDTVTGVLDGTLEDHRWLVSETEDGTVIGAAYYAPEPFSDRIVLIVETSSTDQYALTHEFYPKHGFAEEARIRRFYGPDDHTVVFWKLLATQV